MAKIETLLEDAYEEVKADVVNGIKTHPQYDQVVQALAEKGVQALIALVTGA